MNQHCTEPDRVARDKPDVDAILREKLRVEREADEPESSLIAMVPAFILSASLWVILCAAAVLVWKFIL